MKKLAVAVFIVALAASAAFYTYRLQDNSKAAAPASVAVVKRGRIRQSVAASGKIVSNLDVEIKCKASGEITKLPFDISQTVRRGDLLLELDPIEEQRRVRQSEASLAASEARLRMSKENLSLAELNLATKRSKTEASLAAARAGEADARSKAARAAELFERLLISREEAETAATKAAQAAADLKVATLAVEELAAVEKSLELSRLEVLIAEAQAENDRIALDLSRQRLRDTRVPAPMDGVITARNVQIGQIISSGISNVGGGTTAIVLSDLSRVFVLASVDESDIGQVAEGQEALAAVDAFAAKRFRGRVVRLAVRGLNVSNVVTFEVKIEILDADKHLLRPEMTASVDIKIEEKDDVLLAPAEAVLRREGRNIVIVPKDKGEEERAVSIGLSDGVQVEIISGLAEGEKIKAQKSDANGRWTGGQTNRRTPRPPFLH